MEVIIQKIMETLNTIKEDIAELRNRVQNIEEQIKKANGVFEAGQNVSDPQQLYEHFDLLPIQQCNDDFSPQLLLLRVQQFINTPGVMEFLQQTLGVFTVNIGEGFESNGKRLE